MFNWQTMKRVKKKKAQSCEFLGLFFLSAPKDSGFMNNIPPDYTQNLISQFKYALMSCSWSIIPPVSLPFKSLIVSYTVGIFLEEQKAIEKIFFFICQNDKISF